MNSLTVLVPVYNEARTIKALVHHLSNLPRNTFADLIFVDDGSTDDSLELLEEALAETRLPNQIVKKSNGGKSSAIREGARY